MLTGLLRRTLARLRHPTFGAGCAVLIAALCATGSALFAAVPQFYRIRLWHDWSAPRWHTVWVYALLVVVGAFCLQSLLQLQHGASGTIEPAARRRSRRFLALVQLVLGLAFGAYVWTVVYAPPEEFVVTSNGTNIHGEFYRALRAEPRNRDQPRRMPTAVWLERSVDGKLSQLRVLRGNFWTLASGTHHLAVARTRVGSDGAVVRHGDRRVALSTAKPQKEGAATFLFRGRSRRSQDQSEPPLHAEVKVGGKETALPIDPEWAGENAFLGLKESPVFLLRVHRNLVTQLAVIAAALLVGALLMIVHARRATESAK